MTSTPTCDYCKAGIERTALIGPSIYPWVGGEVKRRRREAGLTQTQLAVALASSTSGAWSRAKVSRVETGARKVTLEELWILSLIFGCSVAGFMPDRALSFSGLHPEAFKQSSYEARGCPAHAAQEARP